MNKYIHIFNYVKMINILNFTSTTNILDTLLRYIENIYANKVFNNSFDEAVEKSKIFWNLSENPNKKVIDFLRKHKILIQPSILAKNKNIYAIQLIEDMLYNNELSETTNTLNIEELKHSKQKFITYEEIENKSATIIKYKNTPVNIIYLENENYISNILLNENPEILDRLINGKFSNLSKRITKNIMFYSCIVNPLYKNYLYGIMISVHSFHFDIKSICRILSKHTDLKILTKILDIMDKNINMAFGIIDREKINILESTEEKDTYIRNLKIKHPNLYVYLIFAYVLLGIDTELIHSPIREEIENFDSTYHYLWQGITYNQQFFKLFLERYPNPPLCLVCPETLFMILNNPLVASYLLKNKDYIIEMGLLPIIGNSAPELMEVIKTLLNQESSVLLTGTDKYNYNNNKIVYLFSNSNPLFYDLISDYIENISLDNVHIRSLILNDNKDYIPLIKDFRGFNKYLISKQCYNIVWNYIPESINYKSLNLGSNKINDVIPYLLDLDEKLERFIPPDRQHLALNSYKILRTATA